MMRTIAVASIIALLFLLSIQDAGAQGPRKEIDPSFGRCPIGTCARNGGPVAKDVKLCSAANCSSKNSGQCPAGTCAKNGGPIAKNPKLCSAANCSK